MFTKIDFTMLAVMLGVFKSITAEWNPTAKPKSSDAHNEANNPGNHASVLFSSCHSFLLAVKAGYLS